jgi:hypothetical protein
MGARAMTHAPEGYMCGHFDRDVFATTRFNRVLNLGPSRTGPLPVLIGLFPGIRYWRSREPILRPHLRNQRKHTHTKTIRGCLWVLMGFCGCSWLLVVVGGCWWLFVVVGGCSWLFVVVRGCSWLFVVPPAPYPTANSLVAGADPSVPCRLRRSGCVDGWGIALAGIHPTSTTTTSAARSMGGTPTTTKEARV